MYFEDFNRVKSKSRTILNLKKDTEKLEGTDFEFIKELLKFHPKAKDKLKDLAAIEVDRHPEYFKTRCFFTVSKGGDKLDFSIQKCIQALER